MNNDIDLHLHSNASDGTDSPAQLVEEAWRAGVHKISITDHDTVSGLAEGMAKAKELGIALLPGVEMSSGGSTNAHVLGYGLKRIDLLEEELEVFRLKRRDRMEKMLWAIQKLEIVLPAHLKAGLLLPGVGRPHLARALVEAGVVGCVQEAFDRYIGKGKPAYVPQDSLKMEHILELIRQAKGVAVLAHPALLPIERRWLPEVIREWRVQGLAGVEAYHPAHSSDFSSQMDALARCMGLLVTGGSDYHGANKDNLIGQATQDWKAAQKDFNRLYTLLNGL